MEENATEIEVELLDMPPVEEVTMTGTPLEPAEPGTPLETGRATLTLETVTSLMRLAVGSTFLGAELVRDRLQAWENTHPIQTGNRPATESESDRARYAMLGMMFHAYESGRRRMAGMIQAGASIGSLGMVLFKPVVTHNPLLSPARKRYQKWVEVGNSRVEAWINTGRFEETRSRQLANDMFQELVKEVTVFLGENENVGNLVNEVADDLLSSLSQDQQVQSLIRMQGDNYLIYLQEENADAVQQLIQGQSLDLAGQVLDEVRERTVTADTVAERLVRAIFRRSQREVLPPPPPEVQRWANTQSPSSIASNVQETNPDLPPQASNQSERSRDE